LPSLYRAARDSLPQVTCQIDAAFEGAEGYKSFERDDE
jgi:hypothetical protein